MHHSICVSLRLDVECVTNLFQASRLLFIDIPVFFGRLVLVIQSILSCWMIAIHARNLRPLGSIFTQMNGSEQARMFKTPKPAPYKHYIIIYICVCISVCVSMHVGTNAHPQFYLPLTRLVQARDPRTCAAAEASQPPPRWYHLAHHGIDSQDPWMMATK
jgi:hypothetical protein